MSKRFATVVLAVLFSCKRDAPPPPTPLSTATVVLDAAPTPSASATEEANPNLPPMNVAKKWNDAINARDFAALGALHGASVRFYGLVVDNATYCAKMKAALAKDPAFHQDIAWLRVEWPRQTRAKVSFRKKDDKAEHSAYLVMDQIDGTWTIVEESDLVTDTNLQCVKSADKTTLTGTIAQGAFIWHDNITPTTVLVLSTPICVIRSGDDHWGEWSDERMDGVDSVTLSTEKTTLADGTKVRVRGSNFQPHTGSGHYSTSLLMFVESITPLP